MAASRIHWSSIGSRMTVQKRGSNNHYTYSPGKGLVEVSSN